MKKNFIWVEEVKPKDGDWRPTVKHYMTEEEAAQGIETMNAITPIAAGYQYRYTKYVPE